jgi:TldD protein
MCAVTLQCRHRQKVPLYVAENPIASLGCRRQSGAYCNKAGSASAKQRIQRVVQVMAGLTCEYDLVYVARLDGKHSADIRPLVRLSVTVIAQARWASRAGQRRWWRAF